MGTISISHLLLYGFVAYATIFMLWSFLTTYGLAYGFTAQLISYLLTGIVVFVAARCASIQTMRQALVYGIGWTLVYIALDVIFLLPAAGAGAFSSAFVWVGYALILGTPFLEVAYVRAKMKLGPKNTA